MKLNLFLPYFNKNTKYNYCDTGPAIRYFKCFDKTVFLYIIFISEVYDFSCRQLQREVHNILLLVTMIVTNYLSEME